MPKLYTKTGDKGKTSLFDGNRIYKSEIFFDIVGGLDELSSNIGMLCALIKDYPEFLRVIQVKLLNIGSNIAVADKSRGKVTNEITNRDIMNLEMHIDSCESKNDKLTEFLLLGTNKKDSQCHICRTICRKVERDMWKLMNYEHIIYGRTDIDLQEVVIEEEILKYINRLSDFFFAYSRNLSVDEIKVNDYI